MNWSGSRWGKLNVFIEHDIEKLVPKRWGGVLLMYKKVSFLSTLFYITQSINTCIDPVCPDRLILRYCSCNTYLLHRRAELKASPGST